MALNRSVKDEDVLAGFASLHQAMAEGFDRMAREFERQILDVRNDLGRQILDVRNDVARLETRMLRRFDEVDARFDRLERRVTVLEERAS
jgi:predicted secreted Zn-dependent protease